MSVEMRGRKFRRYMKTSFLYDTETNFVPGLRYGNVKNLFERYRRHRSYRAYYRLIDGSIRHIVYRGHRPDSQFRMVMYYMYSNGEFFRLY